MNNPNVFLCRWPRLLYEQQKMSWLKIDFDRWKSGDISESDDEDTKLRKMAGLGGNGASPGDITSISLFLYFSSISLSLSLF